MSVHLRLDAVVKRFGTATVCNGITLDIMRGEMVCLVGASGAGKSTLLRLINLLEPVDDGQIWLDGTDIAEPGLDPAPIRRRIGMVFQSYNLFPHMTALENVTLAPRRVYGQDRSTAQGQARALFEQFGLQNRMHSFPDQLSGGQQQRVAIIRALAMSPEIMLFDEITSALDPMLTGEVLDALHQLKAQGITMVLATHEMRFAREAADKVCFLKDGQIVEEGPPETFFDAPKHPDTQSFLARSLK